MTRPANLLTSTSANIQHEISKLFCSLPKVSSDLETIHLKLEHLLKFQGSNMFYYKIEFGYFCLVFNSFKAL